MFQKPSPEGAADQEVLAKAVDWLNAGRRVALVTVLHTWGSAPRPPGALLAMHEAGGFVGSVSGGCVEAELISRYAAGELGGPFPTQVDFGVDRQEAGRLGLPCGGRLELLVEQLESAVPLQLLLARLDQGLLVARRVCLNTGEASLHENLEGPELQIDENNLIKVFGPAWQLLLVGDGQLARFLARMARMLDFRIRICDPRPEFADPDPLPFAVYDKRMPDDAVRETVLGPRAALVTLAHDPKQDDLALTAALDTRAFYIGALGSRRSAAARRKRLASLGHTPEEIARIRGPAGLPIGSRRPAEIALSILAEVTAARNGMAPAGG